MLCSLGMKILCFRGRHTAAGQTCLDSTVARWVRSIRRPSLLPILAHLPVPRRSRRGDAWWMATRGEELPLDSVLLSSLCSLSSSLTGPQAPPPLSPSLMVLHPVTATRSRAASPARFVATRNDLKQGNATPPQDLPALCVKW
jgi:hypothetical protein